MLASMERLAVFELWDPPNLQKHGRIFANKGVHFMRSDRLHA